MYCDQAFGALVVTLAMLLCLIICRFVIIFVIIVVKESADCCVVTTLDNKMHGFQSGDTVTFKEVTGMTALNNMQCQIEGLLLLFFRH